MRNGFEAFFDLKETYFWRFRCQECDLGRVLVWPLTVVFLLTVRIIFQILQSVKIELTLKVKKIDLFTISHTL